MIKKMYMSYDDVSKKVEHIDGTTLNLESFWDTLSNNAPKDVEIELDCDEPSNDGLVYDCTNNLYDINTCINVYWMYEKSVNIFGEEVFLM